MVEFRFKGELAAGRPVLGTFLRTLSPSLVEILGYAGLDFVIVDAEHGLGNLESMENLVRAAEVSGVLPLIRVPENSPMEIMRPLDAGFLGVQIPHVASEEDARRAVEA